MTKRQTAATPPHDAPTTYVNLARAEGCGHPLLTVRVPGAYVGQCHISRADLATLLSQAQALMTELDAGDALDALKAAPPV